MNNDQQLSKFLRETEFCDVNHPEIQILGNYFKDKFPSVKDRAIAIFNFVRDEIKYRLGPWNKKASVTLFEKRGMCTSSTNLLVALMRASSIPAGYCIFRVRGGESFGHLVPRIIKRTIDHDSVHIVGYVYINNKWIKCDASTDKEFSESSSHISNITKLITWDGEHDDVHLMPKEHIISISDPIDNIDFQLRKKPRKFTQVFGFHVGNGFIDYLRLMGKDISNSKMLEESFEKWYRKKYLKRYILLKLNATRLVNNVRKISWQARYVHKIKK